MSAPADPAKRRQDAAQREVSKLHAEARKLAKRIDDEGGVEMAKQAADILLAVAKQKADNAGLAKRYADRVDARVATAASVDDWVNEGAE